MSPTRWAGAACWCRCNHLVLCLDRCAFHVMQQFFAAFVSSLNAKLRAATIAGLRAHDLVTVRSLSDGTPPPTPMNSSPSKPGSGGAGLTHQAAQSTALAQAAGGDIESGTGDGAPASAMAPAKETSVPANSPLVVDGATPVAAGIV